MLTILLLLLWLLSIAYLHYRSQADDENYKNGLFDRLLRLFVFLFGLIVLFTICYDLIIILSSIRIVEV